jgi:hypothetical protein
MIRYRASNRSGGIGLVLALYFSLGPTSPARSAARQPVEPPAPADLRALHEQWNFFALRSKIEESSELDLGDPESRFLAASVKLAFNRPAESIVLAEAVLETEGLDPMLTFRLQQLLMAANLRLHRYVRALSAARSALASPAREEDPTAAQEIDSILPLLEALADVPPQEAQIQRSSRLALEASLRVPLKFGDQKRQYNLDTGANFSVMMASEAEDLGLVVRRVGVEVAASTGSKVSADITVAPRMTIGEVEYNNVVFLVFPDESLTFSDDHRIPGLLGFPVVEAMGEIRFRSDDVLEIPSDPPVRKVGNLALDDHDPLVRVRYGRDELVCRLDTGANKTVFYEPFYKRYRDSLESQGRAVTVTTGGVGGFQELPALRLPRLTLTLAASDTSLRDVDIYTRPIRAPKDNYLFCNIGLDVLHQFRTYIINFRDMALVLE